MEIERDELERLAWDAGIEEERIRFDYSGRGMYGKACFGIVGSLSDLMRFALVCAEDDEFDSPLLEQVSIDSMGRESIYYWPSIQVAEEAVR